MKSNYDDIINLPRPVSARHPRMSNGERAKQFCPFAALKGFDEAVDAQKEIHNDEVNGLTNLARQWCAQLEE
ncbi:MAG: hypothetical protein IJ468_08630 [Lachnospiraceae bacterium]|nr:hypothetical protein [Lachnospiraceae bacterium]